VLLLLIHRRDAEDAEGAQRVKFTIPAAVIIHLRFSPAPLFI
jgi:hypothetical protein